MEGQSLQGFWISLLGLCVLRIEQRFVCLSIAHLNMLNFKFLAEDKQKHITEMASLVTAVSSKLLLCVRDMKMEDYN
jgi:hypothetical protein